MTATTIRIFPLRTDGRITVINLGDPYAGFQIGLLNDAITLLYDDDSMQITYDPLLMGYPVDTITKDKAIQIFLTEEFRQATADAIIEYINTVRQSDPEISEALKLIPGSVPAGWKQSVAPYTILTTPESRLQRLLRRIKQYLRLIPPGE